MDKRSIVHVDISAATPKESSEFYHKVFGWEPTHNEEYDYYMYSSKDGGGGFIKVGEDNVKQGEIVIFIGSDDIEADLKTVEANGGKRLSEVIPVPPFGEMAYFTDPSGNKIGLWRELSGGVR